MKFVGLGPKPAPATVDPQLAAKQALDRIAPRMPTPVSPWDEIKRSPVHKLPVLCNGEASAERDADGMPKDGTGNKCVHYWAFRRIPEVQNASDVKLGERTRYCLKWQSADGPMEFGEGREGMANCCDGYVPSSPPRPWVAALEQNPPAIGDDADVVAPPAPDPFDPGLPTDADFVWPRVFARTPESLFVVKEPDAHRWLVHGGDAGAPLFFVYFRCAFDQEEYVADDRYPKADVRRFDRNKIAALELCMARAPLEVSDVREFATETGWAQKVWVPVLNRPRQTVTMNDALGA